MYKKDLTYERKRWKNLEAARRIKSFFWKIQSLYIGIDRDNKTKKKKKNQVNVNDFVESFCI